MLYFITSNKNKIARAEKFLTPLDITFVAKHLDLTEIQSHSIEKIAIHKAKEAFETLKTPLFVSDHGWEIPALKGFPGAYMKYMNEWLTPQDFLNLMEGKSNREMVFHEYVCYIDQKTTKVFSQHVKGHVLYESKGENEPWMTVSSFTNDNESVAQKLEHSPSAIDDHELWEEIAKWLKNRS